MERRMANFYVGFGATFPVDRVWDWLFLRRDFAVADRLASDSILLSGAAWLDWFVIEPKSAGGRPAGASPGGLRPRWGTAGVIEGVAEMGRLNSGRCSRKASGREIEDLRTAGMRV